ncbi:MAG: lipopolysaccharide biosynthesis protein [Flavobacteriaceae bacterium]
MSVKRFFQRNKFIYYVKNVFLDVLPRFLFRRHLEYWLNLQKKYPKELIEERLNYYCKTSPNTSLLNDTIALKNFHKKGHKSMYYYDLMRSGRYFNPNFKFNYLFGDVDRNLERPTFVKSRPIHDNENSVLLPLNGLRHFNFITDKKSFQDKKYGIVWRGVIHKENRRILFEKHFGKQHIDIGSSKEKNSKPEWIKPFLTINEQLDYKFILSIEGHDVATNLKWIMSSNSLCFMPKPKFETWFMEGKLIANHHYVLIEDDYADLEEKIAFYSKSVKESEKIISNAHNWVKQFQDKRLEKTLSILTIQSYLKNTNQK